MNYDEMSDLEINAAVAKSLSILLCSDDAVWVKVPSEIEAYTDQLVIFDPCNNPSDAWPIILENKIGVWTHPSFEPLWSARMNRDCSGNGVSAIEYDVAQHANPLRAAMVVFLMMKESEK